MRGLFIVVAIGCATPLPAPDQPGAEDAYRAALSNDVKGPRAREARERLEALEWDSTRAAHTVFAYRRFLEEYEDSRHAPEARQLLEGLRWTAAEKDGSATALAGYLEDEPRGAHAADAWARLSSLRLAAALKGGEAVPLRAWLLENPAAIERDKAQAALDDLDWRAATDAAAWRGYLDRHADGAHRAEAQARLDKALRDEAEVLEDEAKLRALGDPAADRVAWERAAALLDEGRLAQLARRPGPHAADAARALSALRGDPRRAAVLEQAAHKLYLPRATLDELPEPAPERAQRLREWAASLDGARLHRMLGEIASPRAAVALAALDGAESLLHGLPAAEARLRAQREFAALQPLAVDAPQLAALAVLQLALGQDAQALASARAGASRNSRSAPAAWLAARLETEPALQQIARQSLRVQARDLAAAHADAARAGDAAALGESCAALRAALLVPEAKAEAMAIRRQIEEGLRAGSGHRAEGAGPDAAEPCGHQTPPFAEERLQAARTLAAAGTPLVREALARAAARDPDARVRAAAQGSVALDLR